jgi:hypothetical protein
MREYDLIKLKAKKNGKGTSEIIKNESTNAAFDKPFLPPSHFFQRKTLSMIGKNIQNSLLAKVVPGEQTQSHCIRLSLTLSGMKHIRLFRLEAHK